MCQNKSPDLRGTVVQLLSSDPIAFEPWFLPVSNRDNIYYFSEVLWRPHEICFRKSKTPRQRKLPRVDPNIMLGTEIP